MNDKDIQLREKLSSLSCQQKAWIEEYCTHDMRKLKRISNEYIHRLNIPEYQKDELYDDALKVLMESVVTYDLSRKVRFKTYLTGNIKRSAYDWNRDNNLRLKKQNLMLDKNGRIVKDEKGKPVILKNVSLDAPVDGDINWKDKIPDKKVVDDGSVSKDISVYLCKLSKIQIRILNYIVYGYTEEEIQIILKISANTYKDNLMAIRSEKNTKSLWKYRR